MVTFRWARQDPDGYEVSSRGDQRFSALRARMPDGRSIEAHYQCDVKGFEPGGTAWRQYKGRYPLGKRYPELWAGYYTLWVEWASANPELIADLRRLAEPHPVLTDQFAKTNINQARALSILLNETAA